MSSIGAGMPDVQHHAIEAEAKKVEDAKKAEDAERAAMPPGFDPALHEVGKDGKPTLKKDGGFRAKRGGAGKLKGLPPTGAPGAQPGGTAGTDSAVDQKAFQAQCKAAAEGVTALVEVGGSLLFGREAAAYLKLEVAPGQVIDEKAGMVEAFKTYFAAKGITDVPPGLMVCAVIFSYGAARFSMPKAQPHISKWRGAIKRMWDFIRRKKPKPETHGQRRPDPQPHPGDPVGDSQSIIRMVPETVENEG